MLHDPLCISEHLLLTTILSLNFSLICLTCHGYLGEVTAMAAGMVQDLAEFSQHCVHERSLESSRPGGENHWFLAADILDLIFSRCFLPPLPSRAPLVLIPWQAQRWTRAGEVLQGEQAVE